MKIYLVSNLYPSKKQPYYGIFVRNIVTGLEKLNVEISGISAIRGKKRWFFTKILSYVNFYIHILFTGLTTTYDILYVHYYTHCAIPVLFLKTIKRSSILVINAHGGDVTEDNTMSRILQPISKLLLKKIDKCIVPSQYFKDLMKKKYQLEDSMMFISPSGGVNTELFKPLGKKASKTRYGFLPEDYVLGFVGRLAESKGWDMYLALLNRCREKKLPVKGIVVGDGENRKEFVSLAKQLDLRDEIVLLKMTYQKELVHIFNAMNCFIFPTRTPSESLGLVGLEAMACGIPVFGSRFAGLREYIQEGVNGYLFERDALDELVQKIIKAFELSDAQTKRMAFECRKTAETYNSKNTFIQLKGMLDTIISGAT